MKDFIEEFSFKNSYIVPSIIFILQGLESEPIFIHFLSTST